MNKLINNILSETHIEIAFGIEKSIFVYNEKLCLHYEYILLNKLLVNYSKQKQ